ncbi:ABC transporter permease [Paenibacillus sp. NPDC058071]|uniref:ABC transporter permease n=1 Tax=Paenibacillus sp. NPDC058071 TaxID=3346326 RepID=UPI0036D94A11
MKIGTIGAYTFLRQIRDYKAMAAFMILPVLLILVLGTALDNLYTPKTIDPLEVGIYSEDQGFVNDSLNQFFASEALSAQLKTVQAPSLEAGIASVKSNEWDAFVYMEAQTSEALRLGEKASLVVYDHSGNTFAGPLLESFVRTYNLNSSLLSLRAETVNPGSDQPIIKQVKIVTEGKIPRGIDYYAVTTMFQCLLFGALFGVFAVTKDLGNHTHGRLLTTPVRVSEFVIGKLLGSTLTVFIIAVFIFMVTRFGFKTNWDGSLWLIIAVLLLFSFFAASMGMLLAFLTQSTMLSSLVMFILSTLFTLVAGGYSPMKGNLIEQLSKISPNTYAQDVLFSNIYDDKLMLSSLINLVLLTGAAVCLAIVAGRRKMA